MAYKKPAGKSGRKPQKADVPQRKQQNGRNGEKRGRGAEHRGRSYEPREGYSPRGSYNRGRGRGGIGIRTGEDVSILEGRHAFEEAMAVGASIDYLYVTDTVASEPGTSGLVEEARSKGAKVRVVDPSDLDAYSSHGAHQGIIAQLKPFKYAGVQDLIDAARDRENALIIATDHVTDAGNFGAIVRTAEVVGACGVLIPNKRNARVNTAAFKTSAGAVMHLPIAMEANLARSLDVLKEAGFWIVGASEHASEVLWDAPLSGRIVLVMGSEGDGLSRLTLDCCDMLVKLPQAGKVESLNVAQATTAIAYEWARQCRVES